MWLDWTSVAVVCLTAVYITSLLVYLIYMRHHKHFGRMVCYKNPRLLVGLVTCGTIQMVSALMANGHFDLSPAAKITCTFWTMWMQYGLGLGPWTACLLVWAATYAFASTAAFGIDSHGRVGYIHFSMAVAVVAPMLVLCGLTQGMSRLSWEDDSGCHVSIWIKGSISGWAVLWTVAILIFARAIRRRMILFVRNHSMYEYRPIRNVLILGTLVIAIGSAIAIGGKFGTWWGRNIFVLTLAFLHAYTMTKFTIYAVSVVWTRDYDALRDFLDESLPAEFENGKMFNSLYGVPRAMETFVNWCRRQEGSTPSWVVDGLSIYPANAARCWLEIDGRERNGDADIRKTLAGERIIGQYVATGCPHAVSVAPEMRAQLMNGLDKSTRNYFDTLKKFIEDKFRDKFWGTFTALETSVFCQMQSDYHMRVKVLGLVVNFVGDDDGDSTTFDQDGYEMDDVDKLVNDDGVGVRTLRHENRDPNRDIIVSTADRTQDAASAMSLPGRQVNAEDDEGSGDGFDIADVI